MMKSAFGIEHDDSRAPITKKLKKQTKQGMAVGALYGGTLGATRGSLEALHMRKPIHQLAEARGFSRGAARTALGIHAGSKAAGGAALGAAALGGVGALAARQAKSKRQKARAKKALISS